MNIVSTITLGWMKEEFTQHLLNEFSCNFCFSCSSHGASWVALVVKKKTKTKTKNPPANAEETRDTGLIPG